MIDISKFKGLFKLKGDAVCLAQERFIPMEVKRLMPLDIMKTELLGYAVLNGIFWIICREREGKYIRVPFAKSKLWFDAITSEIEFAPVRNLPQIYITGTA